MNTEFDYIIAFARFYVRFLEVENNIIIRTGQCHICYEIIHYGRTGISKYPETNPNGISIVNSVFQTISRLQYYRAFSENMQ